MMLQPISPRLSGESGTHVDISCAAAMFVVRIDSTATTPADHPQDRVMHNLHAAARDDAVVPRPTGGGCY
jgi:hypothetical protein